MILFLLLKDRKEPILVIVNSTKPSVDVKPNNNPQFTLGVSIKRITERDKSRQAISSIELDSFLTFIYDGPSGESNFISWKYSSSLPNLAFINITVSSLCFFSFFKITIIFIVLIILIIVVYTVQWNNELFFQWTNSTLFSEHNEVHCESR